MEFLRSYLRRHFAGKTLVASRNDGCFLRPVKKLWVYTLNTKLSVHLHYTFCTFLFRLMNNIEHFKRK